MYFQQTFSPDDVKFISRAVLKPFTRAANEIRERANLRRLTEPTARISDEAVVEIRPLIYSLLTKLGHSGNITLLPPSGSPGNNESHSNVLVDGLTVCSIVPTKKGDQYDFRSTIYGKIQGSGGTLAEAYLDLLDKISNPTRCLNSKATRRGHNIGMCIKTRGGLSVPVCIYN